MYQVHYTLDQNQISKSIAEELIGSYSVKILEHYNITPSGVKHYELLTKENVSSIPTREFNWPYLAIRYKVETFVKPKTFLYVERHYKFDKKPHSSLFRAIDENLMIAKVVNPISHKYIVTIRARDMEKLKELANTYFEPHHKYTEEFCIIDTNEALDYLHN